MASWLPRTWCRRAPSRAVAAEERLVLLGTAGVGEITLHHDGVGVEREHLVDDRAVHQLGVRRRARGDAQDRADGVDRGIAGLAALGLAEVHVVGGGDGGEQAARGGRACARSREPWSSNRALDLELVLGVGVEAGEPGVVERPAVVTS